VNTALIFLMSLGFLTFTKGVLEPILGAFGKRWFIAHVPAVLQRLDSTLLKSDVDVDYEHLILSLYKGCGAPVHEWSEVAKRRAIQEISRVFDPKALYHKMLKD